MVASFKEQRKGTKRRERGERREEGREDDRRDATRKEEKSQNHLPKYLLIISKGS